eukprot:TRINITY_DN40068_c0_g1_i1.p1 TRINITY_DN40068_c0_g1~~TRINITY_DN40068_c0_g1_i1.p1  ORF type:complete len:550 (+),score=105.50 TRINITY_DN40068_c0_g1_i1:97-1746(+)
MGVMSTVTTPETPVRARGKAAGKDLQAGYEEQTPSPPTKPRGRRGKGGRGYDTWSSKESWTNSRDTWSYSRDSWTTSNEGSRQKPWRANVGRCGPRVGTSVWDAYVSSRDSCATVSLGGAHIGDRDLPSLFSHLEQKFRINHIQTFDMDLSGNWNITDHGISSFVAPFLMRFPVCRRLRLFKTTIGDEALDSLSEWVAMGHARELHLSDLAGTVTEQGTLSFLRNICRLGRYPYWSNERKYAPLWLRLENNGLRSPGSVVDRGLREGLRLRVVEREELHNVRPGSPDKCSIHLVLFSHQWRNKLSYDAPPAQDWKATGKGQGNPRMLRYEQEEEYSFDELKMIEMEAREDRERGNDDFNNETFGEDVGWSFEENLAANERLARIFAEKVLQGSAEEDRDDLERSSNDSGSRRSSFDEGARSGRRRPQRSAKDEIEGEIAYVLEITPALHRVDFDGQVRQYLHAVRSVGGSRAVKAAIELIHKAINGKTRKNIQKCSAYLVALLKRFHREIKDAGASRGRPRRRSRDDDSASSRSDDSPARPKPKQMLFQ